MKKTGKWLGMLLVCICMLLLGAVSVMAAPKKLGVPTNVKTEGINVQKIKVSWKKVSDVSGYHLYCAYTKNGQYRKCASIKGADKTSITLENCSPRQKYYFKVQTFKGKEKSAFSKPVVGQSKETVPNLLSVQRSGRTAFTLQWEAIPEARCYMIFQKKGNGKYEKVKESNGILTHCEITGLEPNTSYRYLVRAVYKIDGRYYWGASSNSKGNKTGKEDTSTKYRALLIGNKVGLKSDSRKKAIQNDLDAMQGMLRGLPRNNYSVVKRSDQTKSQMLNLIKGTFRNATKYDVSLFYYTGASVISTGKNSGALAGVDKKYLSLAELASALGEIPGKVIVILDSTNSGAGILDVQEYPQSKDVSNRFDREALRVFAAEDAKHTEGVQPKYGELRDSKFVVMTSNNEEERHLYTTFLYTGDSTAYDCTTFTGTLLMGVGCQVPKGTYIGYMPADEDVNQRVSFGELFRYVEKETQKYYGEWEHVQIYPSRDCAMPFAVR